VLHLHLNFSMPLAGSANAMKNYKTIP